MGREKKDFDLENIFILSTNTCFGMACFIKNIEAYKKIYEIKNRDFGKPFAILIDDFDFFEENKFFNFKQIDFLKNYKNAFTVLVDYKKIEKISKKNSILEQILEQIKKLPNSENYKKIAFRIAHNFMHKKLIRINGPLFLTSANKSGSTEKFSSLEVKKEFEKEIEEFGIKVFAHKDFCINYKQKSSDIFEFVGESLELKYFRKN